MSDKENIIQVVLAVYDADGTYSRHAGVVMTSLFSNARSKVNVTILHDSTLTADNRRRFERTAERWNQTVSFIDVSEHILHIPENPDKITGIFSRGTLFRLFIPDLLDIPKVIYLDCDIVVNLNILDLWSIDIEDFSMAAVRHIPNPVVSALSFRGKIRKWILRYVPEDYFNAGVLLMNISKIKKQYRFARDGVNFFKRYHHIAEFTDQDFFNVFFRGDVFFIEERFNSYDYSGDVDNRILHFGGVKPWRHTQKIPEHFLYWETFMQSEWKDQFGDALSDVSQNKSLEHHHSIDCVKLLLRRIPRHLGFYDFNLMRNLIIIFKELYLRLAERISRK